MLKSFICLMVICMIAMIPVYFFYSRGNLYKQATSSTEKYLTPFALGNIGESSVRCTSENVRSCDSIELLCPEDSQLAVLRDFGLQQASGI